MRYERLVIEAGDNTFTVDLHPRLTVIAGLGRLEREALTGELLGALVGARTGTHVEVVDDTGARLAVFRPYGGRPRVVDVDRARDVSAEYVDARGAINLLRDTGLDTAVIKRKLRFGAADLDAATNGAQIVRRLAEADQNALWAAAEALLATNASLEAEAEALGSAPEDAEMFERVEERHRAFEAALASHERNRRLALLVSGIGTALAIPGSFLISELVGVAMLAVATLSMLAAVVTRGRLELARRAENETLAEAGAQSYLGFHLQRVNGMLSSDQARKQLMEVAAANRHAAEAWRSLAGDTPVAWALEHHEEIVAAARVRIDITAHASMAADPTHAEDDTTDLARVLVTRLAELRHLGSGDESFPLLLDDPFADLDRTAKPALLELLSHTSGSPQLVYLTEDEDVASWARLEALTGALSIIEPAAEPAAAERERRRLTRLG